MPEQTDSTKNPNASKWPYTSFKSLLNLVEKFEEDDAIPPRIDRSVLGGSEGQKTQVIAAMKFLGWINDSGEVQPTFTQFVKNPKDRARSIRDALARNYPEAAKLAAIHATTAQYAETFVGFSGETLRKAMTFYREAANYGNHPLSKNFKVQTAPRVAKKGKQNGGDSSTGGDVEQKTALPADDPKSRYLNMLLEKAAKDDQLDTTLLDRIEKLLGYSNTGGTNG
jgi:hypothetical protein